jgi:hypothetical protein
VAGYMALVPMFLGYLLFGIGLARVPTNTGKPSLPVTATTTDQRGPALTSRRSP